MEHWIADVVGKMHVYKITQSELAERLGVRRDYLNKILNGFEKPKNAEQRVRQAVQEIINERS